MKLVVRDCPKCGAKLPAASAPATLECKYCGTEVEVQHDDPVVQAGATRADRSEDTRVNVSVTFLVQRKGAIELVWLDFEGGEQSFGKLGPGASRNFNTYVGHVWVLRDAASGAEVLRWAAPDQTSRQVPVR